MDALADLVEQVLADPGDRAAYAVLGDYLQQQGDLQGELIALMCADGAERPAQLDAIWDLQRELRPVHSCSLEWRWGFVRRARISLLEVPLEAVAALIESVPGRFLRELVFHDAGTYGPALVELLVEAAPDLESLCSLVIEDCSAIALAPLCAALPQLRRLVVRADRPYEQRLDLPNIRELALRFTDDEALAAITGWHVPMLETLRARIETATDPLATLRRAHVPRLATLAITAVPVSHERVLAAPLVAELEVVELADLQGAREFAIDHRRFEVGVTGLLVAGGCVTPAGTLVRIHTDASLGRVADRAVVLDETARHVQFWARDERWSFSGSGHAHVNGRVARLIEVRSGDEITIGSNALRFLTGDLEAEAARLRTILGL